jgi:hypothetical protein
MSMRATVYTLRGGNSSTVKAATLAAPINTISTAAILRTNIPRRS